MNTKVEHCINQFKFFNRNLDVPKICENICTRMETDQTSAPLAESINVGTVEESAHHVIADAELLLQRNTSHNSSDDQESILDPDLLNSLIPVGKRPNDDTCKPLEETIPVHSTPSRQPNGSVTVTSPEMERVIEKVQSQRDDELDRNRNTYLIKWIHYKGRRVPIVTQNLNGPCPLIALVNVLLLTNRIQLNSNSRDVNSTQLMGFLGDLTLKSMPEGMRAGEKANYEQTVDDAIAVFHNLQTGLDVNVKFTGVAQFEFTRELSVFDLLSVPLVHGWLVDPAQILHMTAIGGKTYNQVVEMIIDRDKCSNDDELHKALLAEEFLEESASQLTYHGLAELSTTLTDGQLAVFFRNNHFSTILKHKGGLFLLVTDQGYVHTSSVVWETLANVDGDGKLVDSEFISASSNQGCISSPAIPIGSKEQVDADLLLAMSLQQQEPPLVDGRPSITDEQYAIQLQQQEQMMVQGNTQFAGPILQQSTPPLADPSESNQSEDRRERQRRSSGSCNIV